MKNVFYKNFFISLTFFSPILIYVVCLPLVMFDNPPAPKIILILVLILFSLVFAFFLFGFYWVFQTVVIDETGIHVKLFKKSIRFVRWDQVENIKRTTYISNDALEITVKQEKPLYLDNRKKIRKIIDFYYSKKKS